MANDMKNIILSKKIDDLLLMPRTIKCLKSFDLFTVADIVQENPNYSLKIPNFGRKSYRDLLEVLGEIGVEVVRSQPWGRSVWKINGEDINEKTEYPVAFRVKCDKCRGILSIQAVEMSGGVIYITASPCPNCLKKTSETGR